LTEKNTQECVDLLSIHFIPKSEKHIINLYKKWEEALFEYLEFIVLLVDRYFRATILLIPYILINYTLYTIAICRKLPHVCGSMIKLYASIFKDSKIGVLPAMEKKDMKFTEGRRERY